MELLLLLQAKKSPMSSILGVKDFRYAAFLAEPGIPECEMKAWQAIWGRYCISAEHHSFSVAGGL